MTGERDLASLLDAHPESVSAVDRLLAVDGETWDPKAEGIDSALVDSLVERGYVEAHDGEYRFTDRAAVRSALDRHRSTTARRRRVGLRVAVAVALALVVAVRLPPLFDVFRDDWVVLVSNDPYLYRFLVDQSLAGGPIPSLPQRAIEGEPLLVATLSVAAWPFGAGSWGSGFVVAWYPVVAAVGTAALVYGTATRLADDARVGLVAAGLLAVTPAHAYRTGLGVADHHAFDYLWLALTAFTLVTLLARGERDRRTWFAASGLAVAVAAQTLAWEAAPLLLFPLAPALGLTALVEVRRPDGERLTPVVAGLVGGAVLAHGAHLVLGWQFAVTVYVLDLLALGSVGLLALVLAFRRLEASWVGLAAAEGALAAVAVVAVQRLPPIAAGLDRTLSFFGSTSAAELAGVGSNYGAVGVLVILGFAPVLAGPTVVWAAWHGWRRLDPGWFVLGVYVVHFGALAALQRRFGGELAPFAAVLGAVGFVAFASWLDLAQPPVPMRPGADAAAATDGGGDDLVVPDRTRLALLGGLAGVAVGAGSIYTALIDRRLVIDDATYEAARWIAGYVDDHDLPYPESYVLSKWGRNRVYNYFVNGEASSYAYARRHYEDFLFSTDADSWFDRFSGRVGFVVTRDLPHLGLISRSTVQSCLHDRFGSASSRDGGPSGAGHLRAVYATEAGQGARKVFRLVPGATIRGPAPANVGGDGAGDEDTTLRLVADVSIPGATFEYARRAPIEDGRFEVIVANPGRYRIGETGRTVRVTDRMVRSGATVRLDR